MSKLLKIQIIIRAFRSLEPNQRMSLNLQNKLIYASVSRSQLPANLKDYSCELIIEEDIQTSASKKYLVFRHRDNKELPFKITLSKFKRPSNLMHVYKLEGEKFQLKGKIQRIAESRVEKQIKQPKFLQVDFDDDNQYVEKKLVFQKQSSQYDSQDDSNNSQSSQAGMAPTSEESRSRVKTAIIQILNKRQKISSIKELNQQLKKNFKIKIPENSTKEIALKVCVVDKKTKGYVLRPEYIDQDERMQGRKKYKSDF